MAFKRKYRSNMTELVTLRMTPEMRGKLNEIMEEYPYLGGTVGDYIRHFVVAGIVATGGAILPPGPGGDHAKET